jgi:5'-phosphate synthase pdxT subunit
MEPLTIGVLALQGAFAKHIAMLNSLGAKTIEVKKKSDLILCDALIIPGGESTTILRQILFGEMEQSLRDFAQKKPVFGTCAGLILMSQEVLADPMKPFGWLDITVERNAFGSQADSFRVELELNFETKHHKKIPAIFIRAPRIRKCEKNVKVLASFNDEPVLVMQGKHLGCTFHPELTEDASIHQFFLEIAQKNR